MKPFNANQSVLHFSTLVSCTNMLAAAKNDGAVDPSKHTEIMYTLGFIIFAAISCLIYASCRNDTPSLPKQDGPRGVNYQKFDQP